MMPRDANCIFCKIVAGEIGAAKVLETPHAIAFLDIGPLAVGHTLLIPKDHHVLLSDMPAEAVSAVTAELPRLAAAVQKATGASGLNLLQNNGREAGQSVDHVHFHLIPREASGRFRIPWPAGKYENDEMNQIRSRIIAELG